MEEIYAEIEKAKENIKYISTQEDNWTNKYSDGFSLLGGEIFFIQDEVYKQKILELIDVVIEEILKKSPNPNVRFSTVTNGFYDPEWLLFPVIDKISEAVGIQHVDVNFSYDLRYRFDNEEHRQRVVKTINAFHERYNYCAGIQMILTQDVINRILYDGWRPSTYAEKVFPGNRITFLYPHPIERGNGYKGAKELDGFNFTRKSFFECLAVLKEEEPVIYQSFVESTRNSAVFKYSMLFDKREKGTPDQLPRLTDGKEVLMDDCGHSILYRCYSDSDRCMLCDINSMED